MPQVQNVIEEEKEEKEEKKVKIGIIGGGWFGSETAKTIKTKWPEFFVTLLEENADIFSGISGKFGNKLHTGIHYPRSFLTRELCHKGYEDFYKAYPELIIGGSYSIYGLGIVDADGKAPKVDRAKFSAVCKEFGDAEELQIGATEFCNLQYAVKVGEPSILLGRRLREFFKNKLEEVEVELRCNFRVINVEKHNDQITVENVFGEKLIFDHVINATSYQALLPLKPLDLFFSIKVFYQPCLGLIYKHSLPLAGLVSFAVMDGAFPAATLYVDDEDENQPASKYMVTHAKWTNLERFNTVEEAKNRLALITEEFIEKEIKSRCEDEIKKYWPSFLERCTYLSWNGTVLAKPDTQEDFRSALTFKELDRGIIHFIPGKVSNVFSISHDVLSLVERDAQKVITANNYCYVKNGTFDQAIGAFRKNESPSNFFKNSSPNSQMGEESSSGMAFLKTTRHGKHRESDAQSRSPR